MPIFPEFHEEDFSVMVDPFTGKVALICPAPIITFDDVEEFKAWLSYLFETTPRLSKATDQANSDEPVIDGDYATAVIDTWQDQILENLKESPKKRWTRKSAKKPKNSMNEE